jgi:hypothetical protein
MNDSKNSNKHQLTVIKDLNPIRHNHDPMDDFFDQTWIIVSMIGLAIYFITIYFGWDWNNFFSLSMLIGIQFYFWISRHPEVLVLTENSITYKFLFYKKKIQPKEFKYQASQIQISRNNYKTIRLLIFKDGKKYIRVSDDKWEDAYLKIAEFATNHYPQNNHLQKPYFSPSRNGGFYIVGNYFAIVLVIFGIGLFSENFKISYVEELKLMGFTITQTPEVIKHKGKHETTYQLRFHSEEFPGFIFILQDEGFRKINGHEFAKNIMVGEKIEFFVDKNEYERNYEKSKNYDYFSSHLKYKNHLTIYGILFRGNHVLYANNYKKEKENNFHSMSIAFVVFGIGLLLAINFGSKYEYKD